MATQKPKRKTDEEKLKELQARIDRRKEIASLKTTIADNRNKLAKLRQRK